MDSSLRKHFTSWSNYVCGDIAVIVFVFFCPQCNFMKKFAASLVLPQAFVSIFSPLPGALLKQVQGCSLSES